MRDEILGLDLALHCGWARVLGGKVYELGLLDFSRARDVDGGHNGHAFRALYQWLGDNARDGTQLVYELAHHRGGPATRLACGWQATVQLFAARRGLPSPMAVATMTLKKWATGSGKASKGDMMQWASKVVGEQITDDNEADAVAVALWGAGQ